MELANVSAVLSRMPVLVVSLFFFFNFISVLQCAAIQSIVARSDTDNY